MTDYSGLDRDRSVGELIGRIETYKRYARPGGEALPAAHPFAKRIEEIEAEIDRRLDGGGAS